MMPFRTTARPMAHIEPRRELAVSTSSEVKSRPGIIRSPTAWGEHSTLLGDRVVFFFHAQASAIHLQSPRASELPPRQLGRAGPPWRLATSNQRTAASPVQRALQVFGPQPFRRTRTGDRQSHCESRRRYLGDPGMSLHRPVSPRCVQHQSLGSAQNKVVNWINAIRIRPCTMKSAGFVEWVHSDMPNDGSNIGSVDNCDSVVRHDAPHWANYCQ